MKKVSKKSPKSNFLRFCFAKGICKKGSNNKVEGLNKGSYSTVSKALSGDEKAKNRLDKRNNLQGAGDVLTKRQRKDVDAEVQKEIEIGRKNATERTKDSNFKEKRKGDVSSVRDFVRKRIIKTKKELSKQTEKELKREDRKKLESYLANSGKGRNRSKETAKKNAIQSIKYDRVSRDTAKALVNDKETTKMFLKSRGKK